MEVVLITCGIAIAIWIFTHLGALSERQIIELANKRRGKELCKYFQFDQREVGVNPDFKKRMKPNGKFYPMSQSLYEFPPLAAGLLKYKKHEWVMVAFEKNRTVELVWLNKGFNNFEVPCFLPLSDVSSVAQKNKYTSVLKFHNHPNSNPTYYSYTRPSEKDILWAQSWSDSLNPSGVNVIEFVCERGRHYRYWASMSVNFKPLDDFISRINAANGVNKSKNLMLHLERLFTRDVTL